MYEAVRGQPLSPSSSLPLHSARVCAFAVESIGPKRDSISPHSSRRRTSMGVEFVAEIFFSTEEDTLFQKYIAFNIISINN